VSTATRPFQPSSISRCPGNHLNPGPRTERTFRWLRSLPVRGRSAGESRRCSVRGPVFRVKNRHGYRDSHHAIPSRWRRDSVRSVFF
jgi:hypothetical protein